MKEKRLKGENSNQLCENQLNSLSSKYHSIKACLDKKINIITSFIDNKTYFLLDQVDDNSLLNPSTKKSVLSLIKKYTNFYREKS